MSNPRRMLPAFLGCCIVTFLANSSFAEISVGTATDTPRTHFRVVEHEQNAFSGGTDLHVWAFEVDGVEDLAIRLLYIAAGESRSIGDFTLAWKKSAEGRAMGKVLLLVQDGKAFGVRDKFSPSLSVVVDEGPLSVRSAATSSLSLEKPMGDVAVQAFKNGELNVRPERTTFLYQSTFYQPGKADLSAGTELDELEKRSKDGTGFLVLTVSSNPR